MKIWYRFVCAFVAVAVVLFSVRVPDVYASIDASVYDHVVPVDGKHDLYFYDDYTLDFCKQYDINDYYRVDGQQFAYELLVDAFEHPDIYGFSNIFDSDDYLLRLFYVSSEQCWDVEYADSAPVFVKVVDGKFDYYCSYTRYFKFKVVDGAIEWVSAGFLGETNISIDLVNGTNSVILPFFDVNHLEFTYDNDFSVGMDLTTLSQQFTLTATNETNNYYNYVFYISSSPASAGVQKSFSDSVFIMSSNQWCMKYSWSSLMPDDEDISISDWIKDAFGRVIDPWGNIFNVDDSYMGRHGSGSSDDGIYYYTLSQQKKCPFYLIKPKDSRAHVIPYSALNLSLDTTYYANIIYLDTTDYGVIPSSNSWSAADTIHNNYREHPLYNLNLISRFSVYSSTEFSVTSGNFTKDDDGLYDYKDVVDNSNPASSSATISSEDNSVSINNANSYDNSSTVSYINYGTIYHNCTWGSSGSGVSSGARPSVPELPEAEFEDLYDQSGNFFDFVADVLEAVGAVPALFIAAAFAVLLFLRIWGR